MSRNVFAVSSLRSQLAEVQWRWVLPAGVVAPAAGVATWILVVLIHVSSLAARTQGQPDQTAITRFAEQGQWAVPVLAYALTGGAASWVARKAGALVAFHGLLVGAVSGATLFMMWPLYHET